MLFLDSGACGHSSRRDADPPPVINRVPDPGRAGVHGALLACAEGVAERPDGNGAASAALGALSDSFYAAPEGWGPRQSLEESLLVAHQAVRAGGERGRAAVIAALALRGRRWTTANAGNIRVWLYRDDRLSQLTRDHVVPRPVKRAQVERACGLQADLAPELFAGDVSEGDIFLITTPGVHDALDGAQIMSVLQREATAQQMAEELIRRTREAAGAKNSSVCVARVEKLPPRSAADSAEGEATLPLIPPPQPGTVLDDFAVERRLHKSRHYVLYRAVDRTSDETVALKFPQPNMPDEAEVIQRFLREEWIAKRVRSPSLVPHRALPTGRRSALYSVMNYQSGENLAKRIKRRNGLGRREALALGRQLLEVLEALHRQGIVHRDVRPSNLIYDKRARRLMVLGLGASRVRALPDSPDEISAGSLSYTAPELLKGAAANERSDVYAAGVTLYRMITAQYPYGRIKSAERWPAHDYQPLAHYKPGVPEALERVVRRACAADPADRYDSAAQFAEALPETEARPRASSKSERAAFPWHWLLVAALLAGLLAYLSVVFAA